MADLSTFASSKANGQMGGFSSHCVSCLINIVDIAMRSMSLVFRFCNEAKQHSLRLTRELLAQHQRLQPWKNIRTLYSLTAAHKQLSPPPSQLNQDRTLITQVLQELSSQLHQVPHKQLNILMEVLRDNGLRYNRNLAIFRALNKQAKLLFGRELKADLLPKSLHWLKALNFPQFSINRILEDLANAAGESTVEKSSKGVMDLVTKLELTIFSMEQPFVSIPILIKWLQVVLPETAKSLAALCHLYYLCKVTASSLRRKIEYQYDKTNARELLFNPYDQAQPAQAKQPGPAEVKTQADEQSKVELKHLLNEMAQQATKMVSQAVDVASIQSSIVAAVKDDAEPFKKELLLYTCDIPELQSVAQKYVRTNLHVLSPVELIYLLKRCSKETVDWAVESYLKQLGEHMSVQEKAYVYAQSHKDLHRPVTKEAIFGLLDGISEITYGEFMAVSKLAELLAQTQHVTEVLKRIKQRLPESNAQGRP